MKKTIIIYSGGLDSTVLLAKLKAEGRELKALSINYGQRHARELRAAALICAKLKIERELADLTGVAHLLKGSSQTDPTVAVPHGHYAAENMKLTVVPNRNALMLSVAFAWAIALKYDAVAYAAHAGDHAIYPDCRETFIEPFALAMKNADWHQVQLERPFVGNTKAEIVRAGLLYGAEELMAMSYSCYEGRELHCGLCGTCQERRAAFRDAGVVDPTKYDPAGLQELPTEKLMS